MLSWVGGSLASVNLESASALLSRVLVLAMHVQGCAASSQNSYPVTSFGVGAVGVSTRLIER